MIIHIQIRENRKNTGIRCGFGASSMVKASTLFRGTWATEYTNNCTKTSPADGQPACCSNRSGGANKTKKPKKKDAQASIFFVLVG